jgi:hypothetical protein
MMNVDFGMLISLCGEVIQSFREAMGDGPESERAKEAVMAYRKLVTHWFPCSDDAFRKVAQGYLEHKEDMGKTPPELAEFVYEAILYVYPVQAE